MAEKPNDIYGTYGSVPTVSPEGGGARPLDIRATPDDFGAQVGAANEKSGARTEQFGRNVTELATHFAQEATEAKVNDDYANKYAPAAANLRAQYDSLRGQDKIHGYDGYISSLQDLNRQFTGSQPSPYGKQIMSSLLDRHISGEIDGAKRELVESQKQFGDQAGVDMIQTQVDEAKANYNNPAKVAQNAATIDSLVALQHINKGLDPNNPDHQEAISAAQKTAQGQMAVGMIQSAVSRGDVTAANQIRTNYSDVIPGYQAMAVDKTLHVENMRQAGVNGVNALVNGQPLPPTPGAPAAHVQASVANAAHSAGIDPNFALTALRIESTDGQNLGKIGNIGQIKGENPNDDLDTQAARLSTSLKHSTELASNTLGRPAAPWEGYLVHQQGDGGGPALLKAATDDPTAKAVDVLTPLYGGNVKLAKSAIVGNGGNETMTAGDYLNYWHKRYQANEQRASGDFSTPQDGNRPIPLVGNNGTALNADQSEITTESNPSSDQPFTEPSPGQAIMAPHEKGGEVVQPAASPREALDNFDEKFPAMMGRINEIRNGDVRLSYAKILNQRRVELQAASTAYSSQLVHTATQLAVNPKFTDMNQVPSDMASALLSEHPDTMRYLENAAKENLERGSGGTSKDMKEYGSGMFGLIQDIGAGKNVTIQDLMKHLPDKDGNGGDLTIQGFEKMKGMITKDPESQNEMAMRTQIFKDVKKELSGEDDGLGIKDPKGEHLFTIALHKMITAIEEAPSKGLSKHDLYNPEGKDYIGNVVNGLKRSQQQQQMDMMNSLGDNGAPAKGQTVRTMDQIIKEAQSTNDPAKKAALKKEAISLGFIREDNATPAPQAPLSR